MVGRSLLDRLVEHQNLVRGIIARAETCLRHPHQRDALTLARLRWEVTRAIGAYTLFKHHELFDPLVAHGTSAQARAAAEAKRACLAMGAQFQAHVRKWSGAPVAERWDEYQPATVAMIAKLRGHFDLERQAVGAMLVADPQAVRVRRPAATGAGDRA
jgi:hypothetical protein